MKTLTQAQLDMVRAKLKHNAAHMVGNKCEYCDAIEAVLAAAQQIIDLENRRQCPICDNTKWVQKTMVLGDTVRAWVEPCPLCLIHEKVKIKTKGDKNVKRK
jgi:hypothetical protein